ncbi:squalene/phytoene synthase [Xylariomycetidae sp. FL0641]|nr:squalene/phytoene synthase [Xylariomycetidae sp. FL0641]
MFRAAGARRCLPRAGTLLQPSRRRSYVTNADVDKARAYCADQLKQSDQFASLIRPFIPKSRQDAYYAFRALNLELVRLPDLVSNPAIGQMRIQFWQDAVNNTFAGRPPAEPVMTLLHSVLTNLAETAPNTNRSSIKFWLLRLLNTRAKYMDNRPYPTLAALEEYAENTYSTLMYSMLAALSIQSMHMDHLVSHIGKACGIVAVLRGVPILAASSSSNSPGRTPVLLLPLDVMAEHGLKEENVYRQGPEAEGFLDAVFKVATRAHDHLHLARDMLKNLQAGQSPGHEYEHQTEEQHAYSDLSPSSSDFQADFKRGHSVLLESVPADDYLTRLQAQDFNPFAIRRSSWKMPYLLWRAHKKGTV